MSIARHHRQKTLAEKESQSLSEQGLQVNASQYELMLAQLKTHQRQLSKIQSLSRRATVKSEILSDYDAYVEGVLSAGSGHQDDVLMTVMVWRIDAGNLEGAMAIAEYAIQFNLVMPERFKRDTATLIAEEIADAFLNHNIDAKGPLAQTVELTKDHDMPDEVRSRLHKALGLALSEDDKANAIVHLKQSLALNPRAGVKKTMEKLQREISSES
ncbi:hypothetical protein CS022_22500 [Veronia nyctiphanis]|uniref:Terminase n=1 Tax=Veronia nyctiphanis TaxID=1278244 RepID=A0A4Q0YIW5_9GAMM|nr:phage terminase small subunit [Veronia nyctiphanis]RXJ70640.1 hypothetical protein CS022_22500 [Veronia nyctiphanis]